MNKLEEIIKCIERELEIAKSKFPNWPKDKIHAAAIVCEESGELIQSAIDFQYMNGNEDFKAEQWFDMEKEAIQTAAMAIRFLLNLED